MKTVSMLINAGLCLGLIMFGSSRSSEGTLPSKNHIIQVNLDSSSDEYVVEILSSPKILGRPVSLWSGVLRGVSLNMGAGTQTVSFPSYALVDLSGRLSRPRESLEIKIAKLNDLDNPKAYDHLVITKDDFTTLTSKGIARLNINDFKTTQWQLKAYDKDNKEIWSKEYPR